MRSYEELKTDEKCLKCTLILPLDGQKTGKIPKMAKKRPKIAKIAKNLNFLKKKSLSGKNNNFYQKLDRKWQKLSKKCIFAFREVARPREASRGREVLVAGSSAHTVPRSGG